MVLTPPEVSSSLSHVDFGVCCLCRKLELKGETFGISSSSTSRDDYEARHKSRHIVNMTPKGPGIEAWSRETPGTWTEDVEACATRSSVQTVEKTTSRGHMHKGASQQLTEKHRGARRGRIGPKWAWAGRPRPGGPAWSEPGSRPLFALGACLFIASASAGHHIHPFIREPPRRRRSIGRKSTAAVSPRVA
jgi:hypothetical protein